MKKFKFNLESVLNYRKQTEENERNILAAYNYQLLELNEELNALKFEYSLHRQNFETESQKGLTVREIMSLKAVIKSVEYRIEQKISQIAEQEKKIAKQTAVVIKATQDTKMLDKLKEKKLKSYNEQNAKAEEKFIEEFVSYQQTAAR